MEIKNYLFNLKRHVGLLKSKRRKGINIKDKLLFQMRIWRKFGSACGEFGRFSEEVSSVVWGKCDGAAGAA